MSNFHIYKTKSDMKIVGDEIHSVQYEFGCNGRTHAISIYKLFMNSRGKAENGEHIGNVMIGECDGTCRHRNLGGFLFDD